MGQESLPVMERARIWAWAPDQLRETLPPEAGGRLREAATAAGLDADRAFPGLSEPNAATPAD
jgi:hypothetical protein